MIADKIKNARTILYYITMKITICGLWKEPEPDMIVC